MRVLFISYNSAFEPLLQSQGIPYLKGLSEKGVKCIFISYERPSAYTKKGLFKNEKLRLNIELSNSGIKWHPLVYHKRPTLPATLFDICAGVIFGLYLVITEKVDIIHARATVPAAIGYILKKITKKKFIFDLRGLMAEEYVDGKIWKRNSMLYNLTSYWEKKFILASDSLVVLTNNIEKFLLTSNYLPKKPKDINTIPCCVDNKRFCGYLASDSKELLEVKNKVKGKFVFLYIGSLGTWYLLEKMVNFFLAAKKIIDNAHFLLLTRQDKALVKDSYLKNILKEKDITVDSVEFSMIPYYIALADAGLFFIKPVFSKRSSCPIKFAEYLSCGIPIVTNYGIGDCDEIIEKYNLGVLIKDFQEEDYTNNLKKLSELIREGPALKERCRRAAKELFSLEEGINKYFNIYNKVLNSLGEKRLRCN